MTLKVFRNSGVPLQRYMLRKLTVGPFPSGTAETEMGEIGAVFSLSSLYMGKPDLAFYFASDLDVCFPGLAAAGTQYQKKSIASTGVLKNGKTPWAKMGDR